MTHPSFRAFAASENQDVDARDICAKTRFALWRGHEGS
jgi:hypothetical protein